MIEVNGMKFPLDRKYYTKNGAHIWLSVEDDIVKIGMDAFATEMTGLLTFLTITKKEVKSGDAIGSFESAKFVSRLFSPIDGEIVAINEMAMKNPRMVNEKPYDSWLVAIKPDNIENALNSEHILGTEEEISSWISQEMKRLEEE